MAAGIDPFATSQSLAAPSGVILGASGTGYEVTKGDITRRAMGAMAGLMASADRHLDALTLGKLREFCRAHDRQSPLFSGILDRAVDNIFGANFDFIPNTGQPDLNRDIKSYITRRMKPEFCSASGDMSLEQMAKLSLRAVWNDGDILQVKRADGSMMPFEADQILTPTKKREQNIVLGVQLARSTNRPIGYHVANRPRVYSVQQMAHEQTTFVNASHAFRPAYRKRFNQSRGVPFLATVLGFYGRFNNYLDWESYAAELNSMLGWKLRNSQSPGTGDGLPGGDTDSTRNVFSELQRMQPGMIFELFGEEDIEMIGSQRPGNNFDMYILVCCRIIGVGVGMPLELILLDFSRTNYSSARASLGEARRMFRGWQRFMQDQLCMPWYRWQIDRAIAAGELPPDPLIYNARCQWPAWEYIDPVKENQGNLIGVSMGGKSISECIRDRGGEPEEVFAELEEDIGRLKKIGMPFPEVQLQVVSSTNDDRQDDGRDGGNNE